MPRSAFDFNESSTSEVFDCSLAAQARPRGARWASNQEISWPSHIPKGHLIDVALLAEVRVAGDFSKAHPTTAEEFAQVVCVPFLQIIAHPVCALDVHGFECVAAAMDADTGRKDNSCTAKGGQSWKPLTEVWQRPRAEQVDDEHIEFLGGGEKAAYRKE